MKSFKNLCMMNVLIVGIKDCVNGVMNQFLIIIANIIVIIGFIVVYGKGNDYVIALEMFDNMLEVNTIKESATLL
jgi:hypothetical protein